MLAFVGELAALGTALCWAFTSVWFAAASRRIGALAVNVLRMPIALVLLAVWGTATRGLPLPTDADAGTWGWLTASALAGFAFGDLCLFRAFVLIGPRLGSLVMATAPPMAAILGAVVLDEHLAARQLGGIALTVVGIMVAIAARSPVGAAPPPGGTMVRGVILALGGALGQAAGLVLAKRGMGSYDAFASTQIRVIVGTLAFAIVCTVLRRWGSVRAAIRDRAAMIPCVLGGTFGPFLGVGLSLYAAQHTATGVAASLMATQPLLVIPLAAVTERERIAPGAIVGAVVAVAGVVLLVT